MVFHLLWLRGIHITFLPVGRKVAESATARRRLLLNNIVPVQNGRKYVTYEAPGKTHATLINKKTSNELFIDKYMTEGFVLPNGSQLVGSLIIFPHAILSWHISEARLVTQESLVLFKLLEPKLDILVFGYGTRNEYTPEVRQNFTKYCKNLGLRFEALPTDQAIGTYNFLAEERRFVAAALIPPKFIDYLRFDRSKQPSLYLDEEDDDELEESKVIGDSSVNKKLIK